MRVKIAALYAPQLNTIGLNRNLDGKGVETWLLQLQRQHLVDAFASGLADPSLQMQLAEKGEALAKDPEEQLDDSEIAPSDIVGAALVAAATNGGAAFLDLAETRMKNTDDLHERELWLHAIAASPAAGASAKIEQLLLSPDLRNKEVPDLLFARAAQQHFRDETWDIVQRNATALLARLEGDLEISLIQIADGFASEAQAQRVEKTITPLLGKLRGGGVQLQQTLERIRDNAALLKRLDNEARCHLAAR